MSNRTLIELNHDYSPSSMAEALSFGTALMDYMRAGDKTKLPRGVTFKHMRHHSSPDPMDGHGDPS